MRRNPMWAISPVMNVFRLLGGATVLAFCLLLAVGPDTVSADDATPVVATPDASATVASSPTPRPTATFQPTVTITSTPTPRVVATPRSERTRLPTPRRHRRKPRAEKATVTVTPIAVPTPVVTREALTPGKPSTHGRHRHRRKATPVPSPTATATPQYNLTTEDSVSPVTCNGTTKPVASRPFLVAPYHGWTSLVSYFDHDSPNFARDGLIITATGASARVDTTHSRTDFPGYWNSRLRQYIDYDGHNGYDYDVTYAPLYAAARGKVIFAGMEYPTMPDHGYGNMVMIQHRGGYVTLYGHLSKITVRRGQKVKAGQTIGTSGNTGHSTGPHLHFTVFHNCSPVDPYGWKGGGTDPLESYRGEDSVYLWKSAPRVINPTAGWPGMDQMPANGLPRRVLLRLPATSAGVDAFSRNLEREARSTLRRLRLLGADGRVDLLRGGVTVDGIISARALYTLPHVVSIESPATVNGDRSDVLAALARAALTSPHRLIQLNHAHTWNGYLVNFHGRTVLVGRGGKGGEVDLKLTDRTRRTRTRHIRADPGNGTYAVDLGTLSTDQVQLIQRQLQQRGVNARKARRPTTRTRQHAARASQQSGAGLAWLIGTVLVLLALIGFGSMARRKLGLTE